MLCNIVTKSFTDDALTITSFSPSVATFNNMLVASSVANVEVPAPLISANEPNGGIDSIRLRSHSLFSNVSKSSVSTAWKSS